MFANDPKEYLVVGSAYVREEVRRRPMRHVMLLLLAVMSCGPVAGARSVVSLLCFRQEFGLLTGRARRFGYHDDHDDYYRTGLVCGWSRIWRGLTTIPS